jgi:molybdate/tungstate transport system ATP-binding protein
MIAVRNLCLRMGGFSLSDVSFSVPTGAYAVLMGASGSGKTSLLETICGLRRPTAGCVWLQGRDVTALPPSLRGIGYVPQDGALFPTLSVRENIAFPLTIRHRPSAFIRARVDDLAELLSIHHLLDRPPTGLSGGECRRVALGRALAGGPAILCLDEPLTGLDPETHATICDLLRQVHAFTHATVLHVTHTQNEADCLAEVLLRLTPEDGVCSTPYLKRSQRLTEPYRTVCATSPE